MITSMTGYGQSGIKSDDTEVLVEIRSVNNRYLDLSVKVPRSLASYEQRIRDFISARVERGRVTLSIIFKNGEERYQDLQINKGLLQTFVRLIKDAAQEHDMDGTINVQQLLSLPDMLTIDVEKPEDEETWRTVESALAQAIDSMEQMRYDEGAELYKDLESRIRNMDDLVRQIEQYGSSGPKEELDKLRSRVRKLIPDQFVDENRLEMELAIIADRIDVTEECVRFHSHNKMFLDLMDAERSQGRKLNFLLQEMNREANTIGSKAYCSEISHLVVQLKDDIEKIREQVQNIE